MGMSGEELTAQETALYDRQIRVWGADAQKRLGKSDVFVCGMNGAVTEFCKNIVLAGVGSLTLMDDRMVTQETCWANFLISSDADKHRGKSVAEVCCESLKEFNLMVQVSNVKGALSSLDGCFFDKFDAVIISGCSSVSKKEVNTICRTRQKRVAFYTVDCRNSCGEIFVDLQNYLCPKKSGSNSVECYVQYPSLKEVVAVPWRNLSSKMTKLYFANRVLECYEADRGLLPGQISVYDIAQIVDMKRKLCEEQSLPVSFVPDNLLERLVKAREHPAVCAIIGGILGQEVIKVISGTGKPLKNFFFFDVADGKGIIEDVSVSSKHQETLNIVVDTIDV